jgi:polyphenol oxidase
VIIAPNLAELAECGLVHGFGVRLSTYPDGILTVKQIHSTIVAKMGCSVTEADALIANGPGLVGVRTADCVPILLADAPTGAVAAIHAGWRGTAEGIAPKTVHALAAEWGTEPRNLRAAIGPSIGRCCYEVGPDVAARFGTFTRHPVNLDLPAINEMQLKAAGVSNIWKSGECSFCAVDAAGPLFHSFRRDREAAGRMVSFVGWQKPDA